MTHPSDAALTMLSLLADGYGTQEAAEIAFAEHANSAAQWHRVRRATWGALGAVSDLSAYARARDRGLIRAGVPV